MCHSRTRIMLEHLSGGVSMKGEEKGGGKRRRGEEKSKREEEKKMLHRE